MKKHFKETTYPKTNSRPQALSNKFPIKKNHAEFLQSKYERFHLIDGSHPWQEAMKDQVVLYHVRELNKGKVTYFNYDLAKEMGLIHLDHPSKLNKELERAIIKTFSIQIINEYEQQVGAPHKPTLVKKNKYMATRYLQLQHSSRTGKTSGDGRSIWNGFIKNNGRIWDISSRGTGVTCLAPGAVAANKFLKTGNDDFGYGCGQMEIDELYATAISSEIFHHNGIPTERVLAIIDLGKGVAIGVRASLNLLRPAHLFLFLKQNNFDALKRSVDYFIQRQITNKEWAFQPHKNKYDQFLEHIIESFSKLVARLDADYIFTWMDWDGDNILANGGIIDYGSIRQFGVRHDQYRYDDVDRFSTTLNEQKLKARHIVQSFVQIVDFLKNKNKTNIIEYRYHPKVIEFEKKFHKHLIRTKLINLGFTNNDVDYILNVNPNAFLRFDKIFSYFESVKTNKKTEKVPDGINKPAIFNMRDIIRELPSLILKNKCEIRKDSITLFNIMLSANATSEDRKFKEHYHKKIIELQNAFLNIVNIAKRKRSLSRMLKDIHIRSSVINRADRATGNAIICVVDSLISNVKNGFPSNHIQDVIDSYIRSQILTPKIGLRDPKEILKRKPKASKKLLFKLIKITHELKDEI